MTVESSTQDVTYDMDGVTLTFAVPFYFLDNDHVYADFLDSSETATRLINGTNFSLTGAGDEDGGALTLSSVKGPPYKLHIYRVVPVTQEAAYQQNSAFPARTTETALDKLTMIAQQQASAIQNSLRYPSVEYGTDGTLPIAKERAQKLVGFDVNGNLELMPITASVGAGDLKIERWVDGTDYVSGTSTSVTLSRSYGTKDNLGSVVMEGVAQDPTTYELSDATTLTFIDGNGHAVPIPAGVAEIWCHGGTTLSIYTPPDESITDSMFATSSKAKHLIDDVVSLSYYGAKFDGSTDDSAAWQTAIDDIQNNYSGGVFTLPRGISIVNQTLNMLRSSNSDLGKVSVRGQGRNNHIVKFLGAGPLFNISGNPTDSEEQTAYAEMSGMTLFGNGIANTAAINSVLTSFSRYSDLRIEGFDYSFYGQDFDHTLFDLVTMRWNIRGFFGRKNPVPVANSTQPNQLTFVECHFGLNSQCGMTVVGGSNIVFHGGSFEHNGSVGAGGYGAQFSDMAYEGGSAVSFHGTYFESNNGIADVILQRETTTSPIITDATYNFLDCTFNRASSSSFATNSILCDFADPSLVGKQILRVPGTAFKNYNGYVASASRPYIGFSNTPITKDNFLYDGAIFQNATEAPTKLQNAHKPYVESAKSGQQIIPNATNATWQIDTTVDGYGWSTAFSNNGIVIPEAGMYALDANIPFTANVSGVSSLAILRNGTQIGYGEATNSSFLSASCLKTLAAGDVITVSIRQSSGASVTAAGSATAAASFSAVKMVDG